MFKITLEPAGRTFPCDASETILDAAFREGIRLPHGCRTGGCGSCKARLIEGEIDDSRASSIALMDFERSEGMTLLCSCLPLSDVIVEVNDIQEEATPPRYLDARVTNLVEPAQGLISVYLTLETSFPFTPGQYIEVNVPRTEEWRAYSLANIGSRQLELLIKPVAGGLFSQYLMERRLKQGDLVTLRGPYGNFTLRSSNLPILFIAGGSGLAPVIAMLRAMAVDGCWRSIRLLYGARTEHDLCFVDELRGYEQTFADMRFVPVLSDPSNLSEWRGEVGMVTAAIERCIVGQLHQAYLCGPPAMIDAALPILGQLGIPANEVFFDKFLTRADLAR